MEEIHQARYEEGHGASMPLKNLHIFTNMEALQTLSLRVFMQASLHKHD